MQLRINHNSLVLLQEDQVQNHHGFSKKHTYDKNNGCTPFFSGFFHANNFFSSILSSGIALTVRRVASIVYDRVRYDRSVYDRVRYDRSVYDRVSASSALLQNVGIDLGTTNSAIASFVADQPAILPSPSGTRLTPSVVGVTKQGNFIVGDAAKRQAVVNPENTYFSLKSMIGKKYDSIRDSLRDLPFGCSEAPDGFVKVNSPTLNQAFYPEQLSAKVVESLVANYTSTFNDDPVVSVVTVPAYFDDGQRNATKDAGTIAGLAVKRIINEPTAASLSYGFDKVENALLYIFDAGGGTFDVSLLEAGDGVFEVIQTGGDAALGGDDIDKRLAQWLSAGFFRKHDVILQNYRKTTQRMKEVVEKTKCELSALGVAPVNLPFIANKDGKPKHLFLRVARGCLNELITRIGFRFKTLMLGVLKEANVAPGEINHVILVGGTTRIPMIQEMVETELLQEPTCSINPDEVVALGAAIQARIASGGSSDIILIDVTPLSLGIETLGGVHTKLIPRNTSLPASKKEIFSTAVDNQPGVEINVLQGEREFAANCSQLGTFKLSGIQPAPRGMPQIEVTFQIDVDGLLKVSANDRTSGASGDLEITDSNKRSSEEIQRIIQEADAKSDEDRQNREFTEIKNAAESLLYAAQKKIQEEEGLGADAKEEIQQTCDALRSAVNNRKIQEIQEISSKLQGMIQ